MFSSSTRLVSYVVAFILAATVCARADGGVRLATVAAENGFSYEWSPTEAGATLARPGVRIVIRAGRLFYEVNNATPVADSAPRFDGRDLIISYKLADHLREIAQKYPNPAADAANPAVPGDPPARSSATPVALTLHARQILGRDALALTGTGPADAVVTITVTGELSDDLPVVVLSRKVITTATDGTFSAEVEYGQDSHLKTTIAATATTTFGALPAQARIIIGAVSPQIKSSGLDDWPKK